MSDSRGKGLKFDGDKLRPSLLPIESLESILEVLEFGAKKYEANSWQTVPDGETRYMDALMRHIFAINKGEELDEESGLPHLSHAGCCLLFLLYLREKKDD